LFCTNEIQSIGIINHFLYHFYLEIIKKAVNIAQNAERLKSSFHAKRWNKKGIFPQIFPGISPIVPFFVSVLPWNHFCKFL